MAAKKKKGGYVPTKILEKRFEKLGNILRKRTGKFIPKYKADK